MSNQTVINEYCQKLINTLKQNKNVNDLPIPIEAIDWVLKQTRSLFLSEKMLIRTITPIKIVGDIHGQFGDLLEIFNRLGVPSESNRYLFLGDYVDRGKQSLETILTLFCYKIMYRNSVILLRGNHETADVSYEYGFYDECKRRHSIKLWRKFIDVFNTMSIAATIGIEKNDPLAFCCHGGISDKMNSLSCIEALRKPCDVPDEGLICDLLWSDPTIETETFRESERGVSFEFGKKALNEFMRKIGVDIVIRAHQVTEDGYEFFSNRKLVTVFSAPRYASEFDNVGAVLIINKNFRCSFEIFN
tara:strand:+ start:419 stop:1327 length:909 start_codon:yes stop_codon:yes gene_type:complete